MTKSGRAWNPFTTKPTAKERREQGNPISLWTTLPREGFTAAMQAKIESSAPLVRNYYLTAKSVGSVIEQKRRSGRRTQG